MYHFSSSEHNWEQLRTARDRYHTKLPPSSQQGEQLPPPPPIHDGAAFWCFLSGPVGVHSSHAGERLILSICIFFSLDSPRTHRYRRERRHRTAVGKAGVANRTLCCEHAFFGLSPPNSRRSLLVGVGRRLGLLILGKEAESGGKRCEVPCPTSLGFLFSLTPWEVGA